MSRIQHKYAIRIRPKHLIEQALHVLRMDTHAKLLIHNHRIQAGKHTPQLRDESRPRVVPQPVVLTEIQAIFLTPVTNRLNINRGIPA